MNIVKFQDIKINTQKCLTFLYTNNAKTEREIKEIIPFTIATKRKKKKQLRNKYTQRNKIPIYRKL